MASGSSSVSKSSLPLAKVESTRPDPLRVLLQASRSLMASPDPASVASRILEVATQLIAADGYAVWRDQGNGTWRIVASTGLDESYTSTVVQGDATRLPATTSAIEDVHSSDLYWISRERYEAAGIVSLMVVPLLINQRIVGTITYYYRARHRFEAAEIDYASALANMAATALNAAELSAAHARERERLEFLAKASEVLSSSLDYEDTLQRVAQLAVPQLADLCLVNLMDSGQFQRVAFSVADPAKVAVTEELNRVYPEQLQDDRGAGYVLRTGESELFGEVPEDLLRQSMVDERHWELVRQLEIRSIMTLPLKVSGKTFGVMRLIRGPSRRWFNEEDLRFAEDLARRAAVAVENARLHRSLEVSEAQIRAMVEQSPISTIIYDREGYPIQVNPAFSRLWNIDFSQKQPDYTIFNDEQLESAGVMPMIRRVFAGEALTLPPFQYDIAKTTGQPHGTTAWTQATVYPVRDAAGNVDRVVFIQQDVGPRMAAEEALRQSEGDMRLIIDSLPALVSYVDCNERIRRGNRVFEQWFGRSLDRLIGFTLREVLGERNYLSLKPHIEAALSGEPQVFESQNRYADQTRDTLITYTPDRDPAGHVRGFVALIQDVTLMKRAEEALRRTEKLAATGRLAATVAHEINNPLSAVINLVYLAQNQPSLKEAEDFLKQAQEELRRVSQIAHQTLGFYRESRAPEPTDLGGLVSDVLHVYRRRLSDKQLHVTEELTPSLVANVVAGEVRQIVANLVSNAIDATRHQDSLNVRLVANDRTAFLTVADTGPGISPELRGHLFEPFFTTKKDVGTGLGLWVTKQLVEKHEGTIEVETSTDASTHGTKFTVTFPLQP